MTKRKLVLEGESQPSKVSKVPKAPLPKKSKGKAVELSKRKETQREVIVATKTITRSPEQHVDDPSGHDPKSSPTAVVTPE
nr:hypothetical protein Iba_chr10dCG12230 [Ipomoea batatas]